MDEKTKMAVALKRFALISPILNGQVDSVGEYCAQACSEPIQMPYYGARSYAPNTVRDWYLLYSRGGIDALKPKGRSDIGQSRTITPEMAEKILKKIEEHPKAPATVIYDMLIEEGAFLKKDASLPTVRRFISRNKDKRPPDETPKEMLRFAMEHANDLWQTDVMYGPYVIGTGGKKRQTYLLAYIDDATRLVTYAGFYFSQDIISLRDSLREAVLRRGVPKVLYTDNGKIYRSQAFEFLCAGIGITLLHHAVRAASSKGKIERFFRTVRTRFLSCLKEQDVAGIEALNEKYHKWLEDDYQRKPHEGLSGKTPLDAFLKGSEGINFIKNLSHFNEKFMIRVRRTVKKDATISLNGSLYETGMSLAGRRVEVRYEPDPVCGIQELFLFSDDKPVGSARIVRFTDNAKRKRQPSGESESNAPEMAALGKPAQPKGHTITYSEMKEGK